MSTNLIIAPPKAIEDNRMVTLKQAAYMLGISYMDVLLDDRLKKVRVNRIITDDQRLTQELMVEKSGRYPMIKMTDLQAYRQLLEKQ